MRKLIAVILPAMLIMAILSCSRQSSQDPTKVRASIESQNALFVQAYNKGDAAEVASLYTVEAYSLPPNSALVRGRNAIEQSFKKEINAGATDLKLRTVFLTLDGEHAYEIGTYSIKIAAEGMDPIMDKGKYLAVWQQQEDGSWLIAADAYSSNLPLQGM